MSCSTARDIVAIETTCTATAAPSDDSNGGSRGWRTLGSNQLLLLYWIWVAPSAVRRIAKRTFFVAVRSTTFDSHCPAVKCVPGSGNSIIVQLLLPLLLLPPPLLLLLLMWDRIDRRRG